VPDGVFGRHPFLQEAQCSAKALPGAEEERRNFGLGEENNALFLGDPGDLKIGKNTGLHDVRNPGNGLTGC